jgi:hypothetical protein
VIDYALILTVKYKGLQWVLDGDDYEGLTWLSDTIKPTKEELDSQWQSVIDEIQAEKTAKATARQAVLDRLGITQEEAQLILGGSN